MLMSPWNICDSAQRRCFTCCCVTFCSTFLSVLQPPRQILNKYHCCACFLKPDGSSENKRLQVLPVKCLVEGEDVPRTFVIFFSLTSEFCIVLMVNIKWGALRISEFLRVCFPTLSCQVTVGEPLPHNWLTEQLAELWENRGGRKEYLPPSYRLAKGHQEVRGLAGLD